MKIRKILLIVPPFTTLYNDFHNAPLNGVCSLAATLNKEKFEVYVLNTDNKKHSLSSVNHSPYKKNLISKENTKTYYEMINNINLPFWQNIKKEIEKYSPDLVGISCLTSTYYSAINIAKLVKSISEKIIVVFGGVHPTNVPQQTLTNNEVDYVVRGEGEHILVNLIKAINYNYNLDYVEGISYKVGQQIVHNKSAPFIYDLDQLPFPMKELDVDYQTYSPESFGEIMTSRGCPHNCIYCASATIWGKKIRTRSVENVIEEIKQIKKKFGTKYFVFDDDTFNINKRRVISLCEAIINEKLDINWWCEIRAVPLDEEMLEKMKEAGCVSIALGIESGNAMILEKIKKGITLEQIKKCVKMVKKYGIELNVFFMIGFPWEGYNEILDTINFMKMVKPTGTLNLSIVTPYPGTELYKYLVSEGLLKEEVDWRNFMHHRREKFFNQQFSDEEFLKIIEKAEQEFEKQNIKNFMFKTLKKQILIPSKLWFYLKKYYKNPKGLFLKLKEYFIAMKTLVKPK